MRIIDHTPDQHDHHVTHPAWCTPACCTALDVDVTHAEPGELVIPALEPDHWVSVRRTRTDEIRGSEQTVYPVDVVISMDGDTVALSPDECRRLASMLIAAADTEGPLEGGTGRPAVPDAA